MVVWLGKDVEGKTVLANEGEMPQCWWHVLTIWQERLTHGLITSV